MKVNTKTMKIIESILYFVGGLILIIFNKSFSSIALTILGIGIIILGVYRILFYFLSKDNNFYIKNELYNGLIYILIGLLIIVAGEALLRFLVIVIAFWALISGTFKLLETTKLSYLKLKSWPSLIQAFILFGIGIFLLFNDVNSLELILIIIGIFLIINALSTLYSTLFTEKTIHNHFIEAEIIEKEDKEKK